MKQEFDSLRHESVETGRLVAIVYPELLDEPLVFDRVVEPSQHRSLQDEIRWLSGRGIPYKLVYRDIPPWRVLEDAETDPARSAAHAAHEGTN